MFIPPLGSHHPTQFSDTMDEFPPPKGIFGSSDDKTNLNNTPFILRTPEAKISSRFQGFFPPHFLPWNGKGVDLDLNGTSTNGTSTACAKVEELVPEEVMSTVKEKDRCQANEMNSNRKISYRLASEPDATLLMELDTSNRMEKKAENYVAAIRAPGTFFIIAERETEGNNAGKTAVGYVGYFFAWFQPDGKAPEYSKRQHTARLKLTKESVATITTTPADATASSTGSLTTKKTPKAVCQNHQDALRVPSPKDPNEFLLMCGWCGKLCKLQGLGAHTKSHSREFDFPIMPKVYDPARVLLPVEARKYSYTEGKVAGPASHQQQESLPGLPSVYISNLQSTVPSLRIGVSLMTLCLSHAINRGCLSALLDSTPSHRSYFGRFFRFRDHKKIDKRKWFPMGLDLMAWRPGYAIGQPKQRKRVDGTAEGRGESAGIGGAGQSTMRILARIQAGKPPKTAAVVAVGKRATEEEEEERKFTVAVGKSGRVKIVGSVVGGGSNQVGTPVSTNGQISKDGEGNDEKKGVQEKAEKSRKTRSDSTLSVLKSFPLPSFPSIPPAPTSSITGTIDPDDFVLSSLIETKNELSILEEKLSTSLLGYLTRAQKHHTEYLSTESKASRIESENLLTSFAKSEAERVLIASQQQAQLEADMDAVCCICQDGDVTHDNQILFCEGCNVAFHQRCYLVDTVPADDYFCRACVHFGRDKDQRTHRTPLPIHCDLCPRKGGAFERTANGKWVHVLCAKWQGLNYVSLEQSSAADAPAAGDSIPPTPSSENAPKASETLVIEDTENLKTLFSTKIRAKCGVCGSVRGLMNECSHKGCREWFHVTCARASGKQKVNHGEGCGEVSGGKDVPWTLFCKKHSVLDGGGRGKLKKKDNGADQHGLGVDQNSLDLDLIEPARPPESKQEEEAREWKENELSILTSIAKTKEGSFCSVCGLPSDAAADDSRMLACKVCGLRVHENCYVGVKDQSYFKSRQFICDGCDYLRVQGVDGGTEENDEVGEGDAGRTKTKTPECVACFMKGGALKQAYMRPISKRYTQAQAKRKKIGSGGGSSSSEGKKAGNSAGDTGSVSTVSTENNSTSNTNDEAVSGAAGGALVGVDVKVVAENVGVDLNLAASQEGKDTTSVATSAENHTTATTTSATTTAILTSTENTTAVQSPPSPAPEPSTSEQLTSSPSLPPPPAQKSQAAVRTSSRGGRATTYAKTKPKTNTITKGKGRYSSCLVRRPFVPHGEDGQMIWAHASCGL